MLSRSLGKKMLYYNMNYVACKFIYIIIQVLLSMDKFQRKRKQHLLQARHEVMKYNSYETLITDLTRLLINVHSLVCFVCNFR